MEQKEVIEGNKLIAQFMGGEWVQDDYEEWGYKINTPHWNKLQKPEALEYHTSWDWLMSVVEKIENIQKDGIYLFSFDMGRDWCAIKNNDFWPSSIVVKSSTTKILSTWEAVVDFIKWYNKNKI